jgi:hypothetical protein
LLTIDLHRTMGNAGPRLARRERHPKRRGISICRRRKGNDEIPRRGSE